MTASEETLARPDERHSGAQKVVFLCFTEPAEGTSAEDIRPHLDEHKAWLSAIEASGALMFAGPMLGADYRYSGSGLLVLRADSAAAVRRIADRDPFHARGLRVFRLVPWQINEGRIEVHLTLSDSSATLA
ncbi:YciI family protein [Pseudonocardia yuanmonensis]|uniref:YciI family protein n=1 Tax=Pseudonocardia yuanmonensis TaxID=1095914 RepID=UPI0031F0E45C